MGEIERLIEFCRANFWNDGAEGESVHRLCDLAEKAAARVEELEARIAEFEAEVARHQNDLLDAYREGRTAGAKYDCPGEASWRQRLHEADDDDMFCTECHHIGESWDFTQDDYNGPSCPECGCISLYEVEEAKKVYKQGGER